MAAYPFVTLDVFTDRRFGGNPLAIFTDARGLDSAMMQALSRELNLSEVVFLLPPQDPANTALLRIFTSEVEIDFAGHPNVGVACLLASRDRSLSRMRLEQRAGVVDVEVERRDGEVVGCRIAAPRPLAIGVAPAQPAVADCASLPADRIGPAMLASVGLPTVCVPVDPAALRDAKCNPEAFRRIAAQRPDLATILLLCLYARDGNQVRTRVFAPLSGTVEDPATGSAAAALAAALLHESDAGELEIDVTQGVEMGRPSRMHCRAARIGGEIRAWVGGGCVPVFRGEIDL